MTIEELCNNYQKKMWISMISRLKLPIDVWDIVKHNNDVVYASKGAAGNPEFVIDAESCFSCGIKFGIKSINTFFIAVKKCNCANDGAFCWTYDKLRCMFSSTEKINKILASINDKKTAKFPGRIKYWVNEGYSLDNAKKKVIEWQTEQSNKSSASKPGSRNHSVRCIEYYLKKGFSEEEARLSIRNIQITNGLEFYIKKYGAELGETLFADRISRWLSAYYSRIDIDCINKSKGRTREQHILVNGIEWYNEYELNRRAKITRTKIEKGMFTCPSLKDEKIIYLEKVSFFTGYSLRNYFYLINPTNEKIGIRDYHIDHIFSKNHGFIEKIDPAVIGNPLNLRAIFWRDNLSKGSDSLISKEELYKNYEESKITHRYPY